MVKREYHGESKIPLYYIWLTMRYKCRNKNSQAYYLYGARGITVCTSWEKYSNFAIWARANNYSSELSIDRKNNDGNYCPANCRWVTPTTQARNQRKLSNRSSSFIGVSWSTYKQQWETYIHISKRKIHLGYFSQEIIAAYCRDQYIVENNLKNFTMNGVL